MPRRHGPAERPLPPSRSRWVVFWLLGLVLVVVAALYLTFGTGSGGSGPTDGDNASSSPSGGYRSGAELCGSLDFDQYEEITGVTVGKESGDGRCDFRFSVDGERLKLHSLVISTSVVSDRAEAEAAFQEYREDAEREAQSDEKVPGPWDEALLTSSDKPYRSYDLVTRDDNLAVHIVQTYDPQRPMTPEDARVLLTDLARQTQKTLGG